jgi:hypothetical protein
MLFTLRLPNACPCEVYRSLQKLVVLARKHQKLLPLRPQPAALHLREIKLEERPIFAQNPERKLFIIFERLPRPGCCFGDRLLTAGVPCTDCTQATHTCDDRGPLDLELRLYPDFPFTDEETRFFFAHYFKLDPQSVVATHPAWMPRHLCEDEDEAPPRRKAGAKLKPPALWVQGEIGKLKHRHKNKHLQAEWEARSTAFTGHEPADPDRQFALLAQECIRRLEEQERLEAEEDAAHLLQQMVPSRRVGRTLSRLVRAEAARQGLVPDSEDDLLAQIQELLARIHALRRARGPASAPAAAGDELAAR